MAELLTFLITLKRAKDHDGNNIKVSPLLVRQLSLRNCLLQFTTRFA